MKTPSRLKVTLWTVAAAMMTQHDSLAQGALEPPGPPAPSQKSLQEIWDKLDAVDMASQSLWVKVDMLQQQIGALQGALNSQSAHHQEIATLLLALGAASGSLPWSVTTVGGAGVSGGHPSLAYTADGRPAISHYDILTGTLAFSLHDGASWITETVDASTPLVGRYTSLAIAPDGRRAISYYDMTNQRLKCALFDNAVWQTTIVVTNGWDTSGTGGFYSSVKFAPDGLPAIAFHDNNQQVLKYATYDGTNWVSSAINAAWEGGEYCDLAFTPAGRPVVSYHQHVGAALDLMYAEYDGSTWQVTTLDSVGSVGLWTSLAVASDGRVAISYYDQSNIALKCVILEEGVPTWYTVDADNAGLCSEVTFAPGGQPAVSYLTSDGEVRFASFNGAVWHTATVARYDTTGPIGTSLAYAPDGQPAIAFYDHGSHKVKYAIRTPFAAP